MSVPTNLIPTKITGLPEYTGSSQAGYFPYVLDGSTYKVQFSNVASSGEVPPSRTLTAGTGLVGGGDLSANRVFAIANGGVGASQLDTTGVVAGVYGNGSNVPTVTVDANGRVTSVTTSPVVATGYVPEGRLIIAGTGLLGGGSLANNVTLSVNLATATPQALGTATAGVSTAAAREDHVHPAVDLSDTNETQGSLPLGRGGTGDALSPVAGAVVYSTGTKFALTNPGIPGQVLTSTGTDEPLWTTLTGTGTVTSVNASGGTTGMTFTGGPVTTIGTLTLGGTLSPDNGGTGLTATPTNGQLLIGNGAGYTLAALTAGTGVSVTNAAGSITIDNTAPDQIVSLTAGTAINISGTYPNFTVANTAPDQIVSLTGAGTTSISGTYPNFTITSNDQFAGTVTSVAASGGTTGLTFSGSPITSAGTLTLGGTLAIGSGGTGASTAGAARTALSAAALGANTDITSIALTSGTIQNAPTSGTDIVNKAYADSIASGINFHQAVRLATVAALPAYTYNNGTGGVGATITANANGALSIDGVAVVAGNRVLIKNEVGAAQADHGVYVVTQTGDGSTPFILTRATDFDSTGTGVDQIDAGDFFLVTAGATLANTSWVQQTPLPITVGTTPIIFSQFGAPVLYTAGTGLTLAGTVFSITNTGVTASTYGSASQVPVIAVNAQGQITSASSTSIAIAASQITSGVLPVGNGGTGATTLTANGVLLGNGTSAVSATAVGTTGQVLVGNTGAAPTWATLSSAAVTSFSAGTTGLTPSTATTGVITLGGTLAVANGGTGVTTSTGTGSVVLNTSPALVTPSLGVASADSIATLKGTVGAVAYGFISNTNTGMWSPSSDAIAFSTAGSERLRVTSAGNFGIGTNNPVTRLHVAGTGSGPTLRLENQTASTGKTYEIISGDSGPLRFQDITAGAERMRIASDGNVGIGSTNPEARLQVRQDLDGTTGAIIQNRNGSGTPVAALRFITGGLDLADNRWAGITSQGVVAADLRFFTSSGGPFERMRIDSSGNVGIGTTTTGVNDRLRVEGAEARIRSRNSTSGAEMYMGAMNPNEARLWASTSTALTFGTSDAERMRVTSAGLVGIGLTNPASLLHVKQSSDAIEVYPSGTWAGRVINAADAAGFNGLLVGNRWAGTGSTVFEAGSIFGGGTGSWYSYYRIDGTGQSIWSNIGVERMRLDTSGNVGIGTSSPGVRLDVAGGDIRVGNTRAMLFINAAGTATARYTLQSDDNFVVYNAAGTPISSFTQGSTNIAVYGSNGSNRMQVDSINNVTSWIVNGSERARINSSGEFLVGTSSGGRTVCINSTDNWIRQQNASRSWLIGMGTAGAYNIFDETGGGTRFAIDTSGNWFGTNAIILGGGFNFDNRIEVGQGRTGNNFAYIDLIGDTTYTDFGLRLLRGNGGANTFSQLYHRGTGDFAIGNVDAAVLAFRTSDTERMRITSGGDLLVRTTTNTDGGVVCVNQDASTNNVGISSVTTSTATRFHLLFRNGNGQVGSISTSGTTTAYSTSSDARLKHDIVDAPEASSLIDAMQVRSFKWNADDSEQRYGFVAQELVEVAPEAVSIPADEDQMMGVDYSKLVPMLVKEIQSLRARVAQLEGN